MRAADSASTASNAAAIPVVLFVYARVDHLVQTLAALRQNAVPRLIVYADGAKAAGDVEAVRRTRALVRSVDWCQVDLIERSENFGLGRNVLGGLSDVAQHHDAFIVWEDDLIAVPGTYAWVCAALRHYAADPRVMSVTAWTHPRVTPPDVTTLPYCDGRAECWVWGTWRRAWAGMATQTAVEKARFAQARGVPPDAYGADLLAMARDESRRNVWAVRWLYHHLQHGGLCVRPPWSLVEHIGFDATATNTFGADAWKNPPLRAAPPLPSAWPAPVEHPLCRSLWQRAAPRRGFWERLRDRAARWLGKARA